MNIIEANLVILDSKALLIFHIGQNRNIVVSMNCEEFEMVYFKFHIGCWLNENGLYINAVL